MFMCNGGYDLISSLITFFLISVFLLNETSTFKRLKITPLQYPLIKKINRNFSRSAVYGR